MTKSIAAIGLAILLYSATGNTGVLIEGVICRYACGDNCYLVITDKHGKEHMGLCAATICRAWNERESGMPPKFKGKKVRITVGKGTQYYGDGSVAGETDSFDNIDFIK